jgi:hypothetical protein
MPAVARLPLLVVLEVLQPRDYLSAAFRIARALPNVR